MPAVLPVPAPVLCCIAAGCCPAAPGASSAPGAPLQTAPAGLSSPCPPSLPQAGISAQTDPLVQVMECL